MNYLAHFHLAYRTETSYTGGLLGDFVKGNDYLGYSAEIQLGILLHRLIDSYTDQHPLFKASQQLLTLTPRRVSGIAVDMLFDHLLASRWPEFHHQSLQRFAQQVYREFDADRQHMPDRAAHVSRMMGQGDWLGTYRNTAGLQRALEGVSRRLRNRFDLTLAVNDLELQRAQLEQNFRHFYRELQQALPAMVKQASTKVG